MPNGNSRILIVDDDKSICELLSSLVEGEGFKALAARNGERALKMVRSADPDLLLLDIIMPGMDGMEVLRQAKDIDRELPVVLITGYADVPGAVKAMKAGAYDYLPKPFNVHEVMRVIHRALADGGLKKKVKELSSLLQEKTGLREIMGPSDAVGRLISEVTRVAESDFSVVIVGETGSGKEVVARAIHQSSLRSKDPFIPVDCGAIPETLLESELFGHEKGAFTDADRQKVGRFESAQGGTLFLDEIANMPLGSQAKLLRALQEKRIYRVGGTKPIDVNVRLLVASNQNPYELADLGSFRKDLFYRLNEFTIKIPPLRDRKDDISYLAEQFLDQANKELNKKVKGFSESAFNLLFSYHWPGNVRQLRSVIRRGVLLAEEIVSKKDVEIKRADVPGMTFTPKVEGAPWKNLSLKTIVQESVNAVEREVLGEVLKSTGWNKAKAARLLQIDYKTIQGKVKKFGLQEAS